jgi:hypothetical protein
MVGVGTVALDVVAAAVQPELEQLEVAVDLGDGLSAHKQKRLFRWKNYVEQTNSDPPKSNRSTVSTVLRVRRSRNDCSFSTVLHTKASRTVPRPLGRNRMSIRSRRYWRSRGGWPFRSAHHLNALAHAGDYRTLSGCRNPNR